MPLVSVVVPVYNGMPYLQAAYQSIAGQTYDNVEMVFVDGGSSDDSLDWLRALDDPRAAVRYLPKGTPAARTWTEATETAQGEFIKLLCQDDLIYPSTVAEQVRDLLANDSSVMAVGQRDIISASGSVLYRRRGCSGLAAGRMPGVDALRAAYTTGTNVFGEPLAVLFRRDAVLTAMPWRDDRPFLLDLDTYTDVLEQPGAELVVRKQSIGAFRVSTSSWSTRLVKTQRDQFASWQREFAERNGIAGISRARASLGLRAQTQLRRGAYAWLGRKGDLD